MPRPGARPGRFRFFAGSVEEGAAALGAASGLPSLFASAGGAFASLSGFVFFSSAGFGAALHNVGEQMLKTAGVTGGFWAYRVSAQRVDAGHPNFLHPIRMTYYVDQKRLLAERRRLSLQPFLTGLHTRGGYNLGGTWDSVWAVLVDLFSIALILWIASGLFMWWKLPGTGLRRWGWLALATGVVSFALIIAKL